MDGCERDRFSHGEPEEIIGFKIGHNDDEARDLFKCYYRALVFTLNPDELRAFYENVAKELDRLEGRK